MRKADNLPPSLAVVTKSGILNFLEPSGPVQACNGTDLHLLVGAQTAQSVKLLCNSLHKQEFWIKFLAWVAGCFSNLKHSAFLHDPPSLLSNGYQKVLSLGIQQTKCETIHLHLVPR